MKKKQMPDRIPREERHCCTDKYPWFICAVCMACITFLCMSALADGGKEVQEETVVSLVWEDSDYKAVDDGRFIGEFQLRTEFPPKVMQDIGSVGYAVRVSEWNKGYGTQILRRGLEIAKEHGMEKVLLTINEKNAASIRVCEKLGGKLWDTIERHNEAEGYHLVRRYWIML